MNEHHETKLACADLGGGMSEATVAIIIPCYNDGEGLGPVLDGLLAVSTGHSWSITVVDDGSTDNTRELLQAYADRVRILRHASNRGYGAALKTGILNTTARDVLFFDADGQHAARDVPRLVEALDHAECVFTVRPKGAGIPMARRPGKWVLGKVCNFLAGRPIPDINSGLRAGRRQIYMRMLDLLPDGFSFSTTSLMYVVKSRFSHVFLPIECRVRVGSSSVRIVYDGVKTLLLALRLIMLFDPLRAFGVPALALIALGVVYQLYVFHIFRFRIVGGALLCILTGVVLFHFGLLADQIASLRKEISSHNSLFWEEEMRQRARRPHELQ